VAIKGTLITRDAFGERVTNAQANSTGHTMSRHPRESSLLLCALVSLMGRRKAPALGHSEGHELIPEPDLWQAKCFLITVIT
jgi:hypothetical protein